MTVEERLGVLEARLALTEAMIDRLLLTITDTVYELMTSDSCLALSVLNMGDDEQKAVNQIQELLEKQKMLSDLLGNLRGIKSFREALP